MVELRLDTADAQAYAKDHYISVRVGEVQKLAKLTPSRTYKFPGGAAGARKYGRVEIFRRVGQAVVCVDPEIAAGTNDVEVMLDGNNDTKICFQAEVNNPSAPKGSVDKPRAKKELAQPTSPTSASQKAAAYLEQHHLEVRLSDAMQAVLRERPQDPAAFLADALLKNKSIVAHLPKAPKEPELAAQADAPPKIAEAPPPPPMRREEEPEVAAKCAPPMQEAATMPIREAAITQTAKPQPFLPSCGAFGGCGAGMYGGIVPFTVKIDVQQASKTVPEEKKAVPAVAEPAKSQPFLPSSGSFGGCAGIYGGLIPFTVKTSGQQAAPAAKVLEPAKPQAFLPSCGAFGGCGGPYGGVVPFTVKTSGQQTAKAAPEAEKAAPAVSAPEALKSCVPEESVAAYPYPEPSFLMTNVATFGPGFWDTGLSVNLMF